MTPSDFSIRRPVFAWILMFAILLFGAIGFLRMGISQLPDVDIPVVNISLTLRGAAPEVMESMVVDPIEEALMTIEGVKDIRSSSRYSTANITVEFYLNKDLDVAVQDIQTKIAQTQRILPRDLEPPIITKTNPEDQPILWLAVYGNISYRELVKYVRDFLKDQFTSLPGVGEIFLGGYVEPAMRIWLKPEKMKQYEITPEDLLSAIESQHVELPAGRIAGEKTDLSIRYLGEVSRAEDMGKILIPQRIRGGMIWKEIPLKEVAFVEEGTADIRRISRINGEPSLGMGIRKQRGANAVEVARAVKKRMEEIRPLLPPGLKLDLVVDNTKQIEENVLELYFTLLLAVLLTSLVCFFFLGSFSSTINVILAIPTSIAGAFFVMYFGGFTLNILTLMALSLAVGIVVDDAIVVLENIARHYESGKPRVVSAIVGSREVTFAVLAISFSLIAIFLPVAFMKGIIGKFFFQFGVTLSSAIAFSMIEALTFTPARSSQFLSSGHRTKMGKGIDWGMRKLQKGYSLTLRFALRFPLLVVILSFLLFALSLSLFPRIRKELVPSQDISRFMIRLQTPPGSSIWYTDRMVKKVEEWLKTREEIQNYFVAVGGLGGGDTNTAILFVTLKPPSERPKNEKGKPFTQGELMRIYREKLKEFPFYRYSLFDLSLNFFGGAGTRGYPVELSLRGPDMAVLKNLSETVLRELKFRGVIADGETDLFPPVPEIHVIPDREKGEQYGVTGDMIARTIQIALGGIPFAKYSAGGRRYDVWISLPDSYRNDPDKIGELLVRNQRGELIPLKKVVKVVKTPSPLSIQRANRERAVGIFANPAPEKSQEEVLRTALTLGKNLLPPGYTLRVTGSAETFQETFRELAFAFFLGIVIAYMILVVQFNSYLHPFTILTAMPFGITGALLGLYFQKQSLNLMSFIGILLLMGIVKKNSVLLVDFTNQARRKGMEVKEAILYASPLRLRPILMTSLAIMAGALPSVLHLGPGYEIRTPIGIVILWGTFLSTLITLYVVPAFYLLLSPLESHRHEKAIKEAEKFLKEEKYPAESPF